MCIDEGYSATMCMEMAIRVTCSASFKTILSSSVKKGVSHQALTANSRWVVSPAFRAFNLASSSKESTCLSDAAMAG
jgi:hypothetical protein